MSNQSSVFAVCLISFIVSMPLYHIKRNTAKGKNMTTLKEVVIKPLLSQNNINRDFSSVSSFFSITESILKANGENMDSEEIPLVVNIENNIWTVVSSPKEGQKGGVSQIQIDMLTGKILNISYRE